MLSAIRSNGHSSASSVFDGAVRRPAPKPSKWKSFCKYSLAVFSFATVLFAALVIAGVINLKPSGPLTLKNANNQERIKGSYVVLFKDGTTEVQQSQFIAQFPGKVSALLSTVNGVWVSHVDDATLEKVLLNNAVESVEADILLHSSGNTDTSAVETLFNVSTSSWGLDIVDQLDGQLDNTFVAPESGDGVDVYVVDSGVFSLHEQFVTENRKTRVSNFKDLVSENCATGDCLGHGTQIASLVGGQTAGVARNVHIKSVKVIGSDGVGTLGSLMSGLNAISKAHSSAKLTGGSSFRRTIASLALTVKCSLDEYDCFPALRKIIQSGHDNGIVYVAAAGNDAHSACHIVAPAMFPEVITVGSVQNNLEKSDHSNYGSCVNVWAPEHGYTAGITHSQSYTTAVGTSLASAYVTGTVAAFFGLYPRASVDDAMNALALNSRQGAVGGISGVDQNNFLYSRVDLWSIDHEDNAPSNVRAFPALSFSESSAIEVSWTESPGQRVSAYRVYYLVAEADFEVVNGLPTNKEARFELVNGRETRAVLADLSVGTTYHFVVAGRQGGVWYTSTPSPSITVRLTGDPNFSKFAQAEINIDESTLQIFVGEIDVEEALPDLEDSPIEVDHEVLTDYNLLMVNGDVYNLKFTLFGDVQAPFELTGGQFLTVKGLVEQEGPQKRIVVYSIGIHTGSIVEPATYLGSASYSESSVQNFDALFILQDFEDATSVCSRSTLENIVFSGSQNIKGLYDTISGGRQIFNAGNPSSHIAGPYTAPISGTTNCASYYSWRDYAVAAAADDGYDISKYNTVVILHPRPTETCSWAGRASYSSCSKGGACRASILRCYNYVIAHEIGHNNYMHHAATDLEDDEDYSSSDTYKDYSDFMGAFSTWVQLNAAHMVQKGWVASEKMESRAEYGRYSLSSLDLEEKSAPNKQVVHVYDRTAYPQKEYFFALRTKTGYSGSLSSTYNSKVNIVYKRSGASYSFFYKGLSAGDSFLLPTSGQYFVVESISGSEATVVLSPCSASSGCSYQWALGTFGSCVNNVQTRTVTCKSGSSVVGDNYCAIHGEKPSTTQSCTSNSNPLWYYGPWVPSECPTECGVHTQTRVVECRSGSSPVADSQCSGTPLADTNTCDNGACPTYTWSTGSFGSCSRSCNSGTMSRSVTCISSDAGVVSDSFCTTTKPATTSSCNTQSCAPPTSIQASASPVSTINLEWSQSSCCGSVNFVDVYYKVGNAPFSFSNGIPTDGVKRTVDGSSSSLSLTDLAGGETYCFILYAQYGSTAELSYASNVVCTALIFEADATTSMTCGESVVARGNAVNCVITPRLEGQKIFCDTTGWTVQTSGIAESESQLSVTDAVTDSLNVLISVPVQSPTGLLIINNPKNADVIEVNVYGTPTSTIFSCTSNVLDTSASVDCTIIPRDSNQITIHTLSSYIALSDGAAGGSFTALPATISDLFETTYTAPATSKLVQLTDSFSTVSLDVVAKLLHIDTVLSCNSDFDFVDVAETVSCTINVVHKTTRIPVLVSSSAISVSRSGVNSQLGTSAVSSGIASQFSFTFNAGNDVGTITISDGYSSLAVHALTIDIITVDSSIYINEEASFNVIVNGAPSLAGLSFLWSEVDTFVIPDGTVVDEATLSFNAPVDHANIKVAVSVYGNGIDITQSVTLPILGNLIADAGTSQTILSGQSVQLDGTASSGSNPTYSWTLKSVSGTSFTFGGSSSATPSFTAPSVTTGSATLVFELIVSSGDFSSSPDSVTVTVKPAPVADAGSNQVVASGATFSVSGVGSSNPAGDGISYAWAVQSVSGGSFNLNGVDVSKRDLSLKAPVISSGSVSIVLKLTVSGADFSSSDTVAVVAKALPSASAGADQTITTGTSVTVSASGSVDGAGEGLSYSWSVVSGDASVLNGLTTTSVSLTIPALSSNVILRVTVTSAAGFTSFDDVSVTVQSGDTGGGGDVFIAEAGADVVALPKSPVQLDASGSYDPAGGVMTYKWSLTGLGGITSGFSYASDGPLLNVNTPSVGSTGGYINFKLVVSSSSGASGTDTVTIHIQDGVVVSASAGADRSVASGAAVLLDGRSSLPATGATYSWSVVSVSSGSFSLDGVVTTSSTLAVTAPQVLSGTVTVVFRLTVSDGSATDTDDVSVTVHALPEAVAGADQTVGSGSLVTVDGSGSKNPSGNDGDLTFSWRVVSGVASIPSDASTASLTFNAPSVASGSSTFVLELTVSNGISTSVDTMSVTVVAVPVAEAGATQTVLVGSSVTLDGSASTSAGGSALTYAWTLKSASGTSFTFGGSSSVSPSFTAPSVASGSATLVFELIVSSGGFSSSADSVSIVVKPAPVADAGSNQVVASGSAFSVSGMSSSNPAGDGMSYAWAVESVSGGSFNLGGVSTSERDLSLTAPVVASGSVTIVLRLVVSGADFSSSDTVTIVAKALPTASAGADKVVSSGASVSVSASGSVDRAGEGLSYSWSVVSGDASVLNGVVTTTSVVAFTAPVVSTGVSDVTLRVTVTSAAGFTSSDDVVVSVHAVPVAVAGSDITVASSSYFTLDGSKSSNPSGVGSLSYSWVLTNSVGGSYAFGGSTDVTHTLTAPLTTSNVVVLTFELTVTNEAGFSDVSLFVVTVKPLPTLSTSSDLSVSSGYPFSVSATSSDPAGGAVQLVWSYVSVPSSSVSISNPGAATQSLIAPVVSETTTLTFTVSSTTVDGFSVDDIVTVVVLPFPVAAAGSDLVVGEGETVTLDGRSSTNPGNDGPLSYSWSLVDIVGNEIDGSFSLDGVDVSQATLAFTAPAVVANGMVTLIFSLQVSVNGRSSSDTLTVTVNADPEMTTAVVSFSLVNAESNKIIGTLRNGDEINTAVHGTDSFAIIANLGPSSSAGSVTFDLSGAATFSTILNDFPYSAFGYSTGSYLGQKFAVGSYSISAQAFSEEDAHGLWSDAFAVSFHVVYVPETPPSVEAGDNVSVLSGSNVVLNGAVVAPVGDVDNIWTVDNDGGIGFSLAGVVSDQSSLSFTAPVIATGSATLILRLTSTYSGTTVGAFDTVTVNVLSKPTADAGANAIIASGSAFTLSGSGVNHAGVGELSYEWAIVQVSGGAFTLPASSTASLALTAPTVSTGSMTIVFGLTTYANGFASDMDTVTVSVKALPIADAGASFTVGSGESVTVDGSGSSNPANDGALSYSWTVDSTSGVAFNLAGVDTTVSSLHFNAPSVASGTATVTLRLTASSAHFSDDDVVVVTIKALPVADAGVDRSFAAGSSFTVDGSGSSDPSGDGIVSYEWSVISEDGAALDTAGVNMNHGAVTFSAPTTSDMPTGVATFVLQLTVSTNLFQSTDTVTVTILSTPVAYAGNDKYILPGSPFSLTASATDPTNSGSIAYSWTLESSTDSSFTLGGVDTSSQTLSLTAPSVASGTVELVFGVVASANGFDSEKDLVTVFVQPAPVANAGSDVSVASGDSVGVNGFLSTNPSNQGSLNYAWSIASVSGVSFNLDGLVTSNSVLQFSAPTVATGSATITFRLTVSNAHFSDDDTVVVTVKSIPTANAGDDVVALSGSSVSIDGTASVSNNGGVLSYQFLQISGPGSRSSSNSIFTFKAPTVMETTELVFQLVVEASGVTSVSDTVSIFVKPPPVANAGSDISLLSGETFELSGIASINPANDGDSFEWTVQSVTNGQFVFPEDTDVTQASLTLPGPVVNSGVQEITFSLKYCGASFCDEDTVVVSVYAGLVADAGSDSLVASSTAVTLDGSASANLASSDPLTYSWTLKSVSGTSFTFGGSSSATPSFTAPSVTTGSATLVFELIVSSGDFSSSPDSVTVTVKPAPVADAGSNQVVASGATFSVSGVGSSNPAGDGISYAWAVQSVSGGSFNLNGVDVSKRDLSLKAPVISSGSVSIVLKLTVSGADFSSSDTVAVVAKALPSASAGADQTITTGTSVTVSASGSVDGAGEGLSYSWSVVSGDASVLNGLTTTSVSLTIPALSSNVILRVTVTSAAGFTSFDDVSVTVQSGDTGGGGDVFIAEAGADVVALPKSPVQLDASGSYDPAGGVMTYKWSLTGLGGITSGFSYASDGPLLNVNTPSVGSTGGYINFKLVVSSSSGASGTDTVTIHIQDGVVVSASAGADRSVASGAAVLLDGRSSLPATGATYSWSVVSVSSGSFSLDGVVTTSSTLAVTAPQVLSGTVTVVFRLTVSDGSATDTDDVSVTVHALPEAVAGADQTVGSGSLVTVDGSGSKNPSGNDGDLTFSWRVVSGVASIPSDASTASLTFNAPSVASGSSTFVLELTVSNGISTSVDTMSVTVVAVPVAEAGATQTVLVGSSVTLDGSASTSAGGSALTYAWTLKSASGTSFTFGGSSSVSPSFTAPSVASGSATLVFELIVSSGGFSSSADSVSIVVKPAPVADAGSNQVVASGSAFSVSGMSSSNPAGDGMSYAWAVESVSGGSFNLGGVSTSERDLSLTAPVVASGSVTIVLRLVVSGADFSSSDTVTIVAKALPTASAGADKVVSSGASVSVSASGSVDRAGEGLSYSWSVVSGDASVLNGVVTTTSVVAFTAPVVSTGVSDVTLRVTVTSAAGFTSSDDVVVSVHAVPVAVAGSDITVASSSYFTLDGSKSSNPSGVGSLTFEWSVASGSFSLAGVDTSKPSLALVAGESAESIVFRLVVSSTSSLFESKASFVTVTVVVPVILPVASAGVDQSVTGGDLVTLDARGSTFEDTSSLRYSWSLVSSSGDAFNFSPTSASSNPIVSFSSPSVTVTTTLTFEVSVMVVGYPELISTDEVTVTVEPATQGTVKFGVSRLVLVNAITNEDIRDLVDGDHIDLSIVGTFLNVRAELQGAEGMSPSILFGFNEYSAYRLENAAPFALNGDQAGSYYSWTPAVGENTITAKPYTKVIGQGDLGTVMVVTFTAAVGALA